MNEYTAALPRLRYLLDLDRDVRELLIQLAESVPVYYAKSFIGEVISTLLTSIVIQDTAEAHDAFTRILEKCELRYHAVQDIGGRRSSVWDVMWGHYILLSTLFYERYSGAVSLREDLIELIGPDDRSCSEELFHVVVDDRLRYIRIE